MKRAIICIIAMMMLLSGCNSDGTTYRDGKDTHKSYKNTDYAILNFTRDDKIERSLHNRKYSECMIYEIYNMKEIEDKVYFYGRASKFPVYIILDLSQNKCKFYTEAAPEKFSGIPELYNMMRDGVVKYILELDEFEEEERKILEGLKAITRERK